MKKTLLLLVALITATIAFAYDAEINGIYYNLDNSNQTAEVTSGSNKYSGDITIPEKITYNATEYSVTSIGSAAFESCKSLTSITIPNSVTSIGYDAFYDCSSLTSITIPNSVTSIGSYAFSYCSSLTSISIGNSVTSIGSYAFEYTPWLNNQPDGCIYINSLLYKYKGEMPENTHIDVKEGTTMICGSAFSSCLSLTSITIPNSVTSIGDEAFSWCSSLTSISIPNSVTSIEYGAFSHCGSLTSITIPNSVTSIGNYAFRDCSRLTSITIPNSVTSIGNGAFYWCTTLTSISIPNSVTSIGDEAFSCCSSLTSITCLGSTPPSANNLRAQYGTCILFVPKGSLNVYQNHAEWGKFLNIQELESEKYTITTAVNDESMGSVIGEGEYEKDSEITLTATANEGYRFVQWSDGNTENPRIVTVTENKTYTAEFEVEVFGIYAAAAVPSMGGVKVTLTAEPIEGLVFDHWSDSNTENPRTLTLTEDIELYAYFKVAEATNVETSKISSANIYTTNGILHIEGATENYHILDAAGRLIYSGNATTLTLPRGIYLVTMGGEVEKIVL